MPLVCQAGQEEVLPDVCLRRACPQGLAARARAWGTAQVALDTEVTALAKAHSDFDLQAFQIASFDETRMAPCGHGSIRLWHLHGGALRPALWTLGSIHALNFTDLVFEQGQPCLQEPPTLRALPLPWLVVPCHPEAHKGPLWTGSAAGAQEGRPSGTHVWKDVSGVS